MSSAPLRLLDSLRAAKASHAGARTDDFFFMISSDPAGAAALSTVDCDGKPVKVGSGCGRGAECAVLGMMGGDSITHAATAGWGCTAVTAGALSVSLALMPDIVSRLILCRNIVDAAMRPVDVSRAEAQLAVRLTEVPPDARGRETQIVPSLEAELPGGALVTDFMLLSDSYVLADNTIYPLVGAGINRNHIAALLSPVTVGLLDAYLGVLFTCLPDIKVKYRNYAVNFSDEEIEAEPTIQIEKLGADKSLYLRLIPGLSEPMPNLMGNFSVTRKATLGPGDTITVRPIARTDPKALADELYNEITGCAPRRSAAGEVYTDGKGFFIVPEVTAAPFLFDGLPRLLGKYRVSGTDKLREYKTRPLVPRLQFNFASGIDFLEGDVDVDLGHDGKITLQELLSQYARQRYVQLSDGSRGVLDHGYVKRLERIFTAGRGKNGKVRLSFFDLPEAEELMDERMRECAEFRRPREFFDGFNRLSVRPADVSGVKAELRPYQLNGVKWLSYLYENRLGGCLADDMGLGKTLQAITLLSMIYPAEERPTLIVMPKSLLFNWQAELNRFCPQLDHFTYYGTGRELARAMAHRVILTTYAVVRNDIEALAQEKFHMVMLDESQNIKNLSAGVTKSVHMLDAEHRFALSGTPVENNLMELYSLYRFLNPGMFGSAEDFSRRYANPIQRDNDVGALRSLRRKIYPFMLRRLKKDVLRELPDRMNQTLIVEMYPEHARYYEERRAFFSRQVASAISADGLGRSRFVMLQALNELRRIATIPEKMTGGRIASAKMDMLAEHIAEADANGHKSVVFFNYLEGIRLIGERLDLEGIGYETMTGETADRGRVVERFQTDPACRVLLMTLKTGGVGLNLTAADTVFIVEPWWNKAAEEQAINRLHRMGQTAKVMCYSFISRGTIEEKIRLLQTRKAELFSDVITDDGMDFKCLDRDGIDFIFS